MRYVMRKEEPRFATGIVCKGVANCLIEDLYNVKKLVNIKFLAWIKRTFGGSMLR